REIAARTVAADGNATRIDPERRRVAYHRAERGGRVVDTLGERMLRRKAIVDRDHHARRLRRGLPADGVVAVERSDRVAAAVEEDERALRPVACRVHTNA